MKNLAALRRAAWAFIIAILALIIMAFCCYIHSCADTIGDSIGSAQGRIVGTAVGSWKGATESRAAGKADGEAAGLSAEDTSADIKGYIQQTGTLQVLRANVTLRDKNGIGEKYKALYVFNGDAVFTVDLSEISVVHRDNDTLAVDIPHPELKLYLDVSKTKKLAELQKFSWNVTAKDGVEGYISTMSKTVENVKKTMSNYDALMDIAEKSAKEQVERLARAACGNRFTSVIVEFK